MSQEPQWETIEVPRGAYISWGNAPGQAVTGRVIDYLPAGGTDFDGNPCPQLSVELRAPTFSMNKFGERTDFGVGELVVLNCGQASLKRAVQAAQIAPGDLIKLVFARTATAAKGDVKEFDIQVARGAGKQAQQRPQQQQPQQVPLYAPAQQPYAQAAASQAQPPWGSQPQSEPPF